MKIKTSRRTSTFVAATALIATVVPVTAMTLASPAAAASPSCTGNSTVTRSGLRFTLPSVGNNTRNFNCILSVGNQSSSVQNLQSHLNQCYYRGSTASGHLSVLSTALAVDGIFGSRTHDAVRAVQGHHGITADGIYGPQTRQTILFLADNGTTGLCRRYGA
jgi:Putative peptidoglycan binding domain